MSKGKSFVPSILAEAVKRQYENGKITISAINALKAKGQLTEDEVKWILGE